MNLHIYEFHITQGNINYVCWICQADGENLINCNFAQYIKNFMQENLIELYNVMKSDENIVQFTTRGFGY